jgi:predicted TPR repeat methyltransferase
MSKEYPDLMAANDERLVRGVNPYDRDYYERGVETRVSGYTNYHWRPDYVMPLANTIRQKFGPGIMLDYGCAKGYLVYALRLLGVRAFGYDISEYAIKNCHPEVAALVTDRFALLPPSRLYDVIIAKDVLEHVPEAELPQVLANLYGLAHGHGKIMVVVPLGENDLYRIREYELDQTHQLRKDEVWWITQLQKAGFKMEEFYYALPGVKEHWTRQHPYGNGIFIASKS